MVVLNEEHHAAKGKQTCNCFLSTAEILNFSLFGDKNVTINTT
jgi:hypothetical protein